MFFLDEIYCSFLGGGYYRVYYIFKDESEFYEIELRGLKYDIIFFSLWRCIVGLLVGVI